MFYRKSDLKGNKVKKGKDRPFLGEVFQFPFNIPWRHLIRIANSTPPQQRGWFVAGLQPVVQLAINEWGKIKQIEEGVIDNTLRGPSSSR